MPKGIYERSLETRKRMSLAKITDNPKKNSMHWWVIRNFDKPSECEICGKIHNTMAWSNKDHKYKRDRKFWQYVCITCHIKYDTKYLRKWNTKKCKCCGREFQTKYNQKVHCDRSCAIYYQNHKEKTPPWKK